jgi:hypothetical protein
VCELNGLLQEVGWRVVYRLGAGVFQNVYSYGGYFFFLA